ncbi:MAG TPA: L-ribulose-5-phosphate 4-epimerase AraD [Phycisphaerae bacterium]|nr:L-ribulose-5-phosphate 4-epimerase AraD [Phycisphaerae bacterium]HUU58211.1 L-ribulose-5-phosphate 4-epimerase AraD [Phycisphaerae bacterium]
MLEQLKEQVCEANLRLAAEGLVIQTWGNVSGVDRDGGNLVIKPSGVGYEGMKPSQMVVVSLETGRPVEGDLHPSTDTPTHLELYRAMAGIGGVVHTHSTCATAWAQARKEILPLGTTHADYFYGPIPCTRLMTAKEIAGEYEANTGKVIVERFADLDPLQVPGVLMADHGPFAWGETPDAAVHNAVILEHLARLATETLRVDPYPKPVSQSLLDKHFLRKHGPGAYYGQK